MGLLIKLQNGDTALKSLKFGHDRPGGGDSNQPYIKNPIDRPNTPALNSDFLLRGGISAPLNALEDVARLTKYFFDFKNPSGLLFTTKQNLLSRIATKTEASFGAAYGGGGINEGIYTPLSTLAQAGVVAFGGHLNKQGLDPTGTFRDLADPNIVQAKKTYAPNATEFKGSILAINKYQDVAYNNNREDKNHEADDVLLLLDRESGSNRRSYSATPNFILNNKSLSQGKNLYTNRLLKLRDTSGLNPNSPDTSSTTLYSYKGGPNSILGFGVTDIKFATGNDGLLPLRTNRLYSLIGSRDEKEKLKRKNIYFQTDIIFGNLYSPNPGVSLLYSSSFKDSLYYDSTNIFYDGKSYKNYVKNHSGYQSFQPWAKSFVTPSSSSENPRSYLAKKQHTPKSIEDFPQPIFASSTYNAIKNYKGDQVKYEFSYVGKPYYGIAYNTSVYDSGSLNPRADLKTYLTKEDPDILPVQRSNDELTKRPYTSSINSKLNDYERELITDPVPDYSGSFSPQDPKGNLLGKYSSENTLITDPVASKELNEIKKVELLNNPSTKGYLANLNKNGDPTSHNPPREGGGRGISVDFRSVNREKRGFIDKEKAWDYISISSSYDVNTALESKVYYNSSEYGKKRTSKELLTDFNDLIEFNFTILDPSNPSSPGTVLDFRAYIDSFSDSYNNDWKAQTYMGRAEKQYKYNSFDRSISLGFTIVADNQTNLEQMYSQLNTLASSIAPSYTSQGYMAGVLHKLTVGNYIYKQYGILQGLTFEITDETPWQIDKGNQLPLYIKVTGIKFVPIHVFRPQVILDKEGATNSGNDKYNVPVPINDQYERYIYQTDGNPN
jgi:hypothetical protein